MSEREFFIRSLFVTAIALVALNTGCSTLWPQDKSEVPPTVMIDGAPATRFSENNNVLNPANRNYKKMTRARMEEESELHAQAGSTWVMEGQGAYLFAQNKTRREGDLLNVKIEGPGQKQVETKVSVIKLLLKQLEEEELRQKEADKPSPPVLASAKAAEKTEKSEPGRKPAGELSGNDKKKEDEGEMVDMVPTRIVERLPDGNYRVKGQQPFMIGKREYKVIVTGIVRPDDFNDEGITSNKLLDPQFDVVSLRRKNL